MSSYFYMAILCAVNLYIMVREIYRFSKGKYYTYFTWNKTDSFKKKVLDICLLIVVWVSIYNLPPETMPNFLPAFILIALCLVFSTLNYLTYVKIRDSKIFIHALILDILVIALFLIIELM
ncbi:hypothetical protein [Desulfosporosinus meridiei]|uniref:DUF4181 domain-containing protein n=1 Tax=Desulfosporosinus meridiei (strain ATCC BAA-275 / DSM 13257 / KCTC 12902 / NCIMB 13706 / S10) TaxID=768704 RepID=J7ITH4_DESMD|nr:hypothetical protein [Desulfosporosinus meridiei]AFQ43464.1 hypothetical protein Desmer_1471 [Desulfosporosinus meridiei DSM 13257]